MGLVRLRKRLAAACFLCVSGGLNGWLILTSSSEAAVAAESSPLAKMPRTHDPSTILKCHGEYWVFATGRGILSRHSRDLGSWQEGPSVFTAPPAWTTNAVPGNRGYFWAPDVIQISNRYFLYYSVSTWGSRNSAIGLATNPTLDPADAAYRWTDQGLVLRTSLSNDFNAIDPSVLLARDGKLWLAFGSYWSGIKLVELDPATGRRLDPGAAPKPLAWQSAIEAACLLQRDQWYYLVVDWGTCCRGTNSTYNLRVGRSQSVTGPYLDQSGKDMLQGGGTLLLESKPPFIGPGHVALLRDGRDEWLSFHYYNGQNSGIPALALRRLSWNQDGWPVIEPPAASAQGGIR